MISGLSVTYETEDRASSVSGWHLHDCQMAAAGPGVTSRIFFWSVSRS